MLIYLCFLRHVYVLIVFRHIRKRILYKPSYIRWNYILMKRAGQFRVPRTNNVLCFTLRRKYIVYTRSSRYYVTFNVKRVTMITSITRRLAISAIRFVRHTIYSAKREDYYVYGVSHQNIHNHVISSVVGRRKSSSDFDRDFQCVRPS